jgi:hypothetical protein
MNRALLSLTALATFAAAALAIVPACNSSSSSSGVGTSGYCADLTSLAQKCNLTDPCSQAEVRDCAQIASSLSNAAVNAAEQCLGGNDVQCPNTDGGTTSATTQCYTNALLGAQPTAAQQKLAQDYCNACAASMNLAVDACTSGFFKGADGGSGGLGTLFLYYNDDLITKIDQTCTPAFSTDAGSFGCSVGLLVCGTVVLQQNVYSPPECRQDAGSGFGASDAGPGGG